MPHNTIVGHARVPTTATWSRSSDGFEPQPYAPFNYVWGEPQQPLHTPEEIAELEQEVAERLNDNFRELGVPDMTAVLNEAQSRTDKAREIRRLDNKLIKVKRVRDYGYRQPYEENPF